MAIAAGLMPPKVDLGHHYNSTLSHAMGQYRRWKDGEVYAGNRRTIMGFIVPEWQRGLVWTLAQKVSFIESAWLGIPLGTYAYNEAFGSPDDYLLIDGQQRMSAIEDYVEDRFPVFGHFWSGLSKVDGRRWSMTTMFPHYVTQTTDESVLRNYYNLTNFGGTAHKESERA